MATVSPTGVSYWAAGDAIATREAIDLAHATSVNNAIGLVPIIPTSVGVGSGSASVGTTGLVTFSAASSISLNGVFTSAYRNYSMTFSFTSGTPVNMPVNFRFRVSGSDNATSYQWNVTKVYYNGLSQLGSSGATFSEIAYSGADANGVARVDVFNPFLAITTHASMFRSYNNENATGGFWHNVSSSFDGFSIFPQSNTLTGNVQVYGLR